MRRSRFRVCFQPQFVYFWLLLLFFHKPNAVCGDNEDFEDPPYDDTYEDEPDSLTNITESPRDAGRDESVTNTGLNNETNDDKSSIFKDLQALEPENVSHILDKIFKNYAKQERPYYRVQPSDVQIRFDIASISHISEENMEFRASVYFTQTWWDPRLKYNPIDNKSYIILRDKDINKLWLPDTYISNARSYTIDPYTPTVKIYGDGLIDYSYLLSITLLSQMDFLYYPMDHQTLHIDIFTYTYSFSQIQLSWDSGSMLLKEIPTFVVKKVEKIEEVQSDGFGKEYSLLSFRIIVRRRLRYFLLQFFFPCILCALVSCLPFWMDRYEIGERLALGITTLLTEVFLSQYINSSMPRVSYIKAADEYLLGTFIFIFSALLESVVVYNYRPDVLERKRQEMESKRSSKKPSTNVNVGCDNIVTSLDEINGVEMNFYSESSETSQDEKDQTTSPEKTDDDPVDVASSRDISLFIDKSCRILFPLMFLIFQGYYFGRYCPSFYRA